MAEPRTEILHIRLSSDERERLRFVADESYLPESTWARQAVLRALDQWEARRRAVAERPKER